MTMEEYKNYYFKDAGDGARFISGLPLPRDPDGVVRNKRFVGCEFHPCCKAKFENCELVDCDWQENKKGNFEIS